MAGAARPRRVLALLSVSSLLAIPYATLLPAVASEVLGGGAGLFGLLQALAGAGAFIGAVSLLGRSGLRGLARRLGLGATCLGVGVLLLGLSSSHALSGFALLLAGGGMITQMAGTMTLLQGLAGPGMRGRVMGVFSTLFVGVAPFGALASGAVAGRIGVQATLAIGGAVVIAASLAYHAALPGLRDALREAHPEVADAGIP